jgi:hypothetical protein
MAATAVTTEELFLEQIETVMKNNEIEKQIKQLASKAINSGLFDKTEVESGFKPALYTMIAILRSIADDLEPHHPESLRECRRITNNINSFI